MSEIHLAAARRVHPRREEYALPIAAVHEIIRFTEPRSVASEVAWIRGVIGLRGKIIPIFDLAARLGLAAGRRQPGKIVIVETGGGQVGVMVDEVEEVLTVDADQLEAVPTANTDTIEAIAKIGDRLVVLLNPEGLFAAAPRRRPRGGRVSEPHGSGPRPAPARAASSSPTTRGSCAACSPTRSAARASTSSAPPPTATRRSTLCRAHRPDALTLDLHMPGLDGLGVLRALRDGKAEPVPVVVVSAFSPAHGAHAVDALAEGAFELVAKPAVGEPLDDFAGELGRKVGDAAHAAAPPPGARRAAPPGPPAPRRARAPRRAAAPAPARCS